MGSRPLRRSAGIGLLATALALLVLAVVLLCFVFGRVVPVTASGMEPTLLPGDLVWVYTRAYQVREPRAGEVAVVRLAAEGDRLHARDRRPDLPTQPAFGRIVGTPGDRVENEPAALRINGERMMESRVGSHFVDDRGRRPSVWEVQIGGQRFLVARVEEEHEADLPLQDLPPERYLLMGDYRTRAYDGRYWGSVHRSDLVGVAVLVLFSRDPATGRIRWERIGEAVE